MFSLILGHSVYTDRQNIIPVTVSSLYSCGQITGDTIAGRKLDPRPPSQPPTTPRTPRSTLQSSLCAQVTAGEPACATDGQNTAVSDTVVHTAAAATQPQKRAPSTSVNDVAHDREDKITAKRMRGANVEVHWL